jgi:nucleotide-binding universal stress UspA family protein
MWCRIVVPLDGSALAETILPHVGGLASNTPLEVDLLMVGALPGELVRRDDDGPYIDQIVAAEEHQLGQYLRQQAERLGATGVVAKTHVAIGDPAGEIVRYAQEEHADAIAMSTHGRGGVEQILHGSTAAAVLRTAGVPVLLFRPAEDAFIHHRSQVKAPAEADERLALDWRRLREWLESRS